MPETHDPKPTDKDTDTDPSVPPPIRVEGLAETLASIRHFISDIDRAHKFDWANSRLILLRNFVIAFLIVSVTAIFTLMASHEAFRQTLTISAFDVPDSLASRGITGNILAKHLFDELVKRRQTVTTLDAGELRSAAAERHSDVAVPTTGISLQTIFRYLRVLTGREIVIDGEITLDGDTITLAGRVAGHVPRKVTGKLAEMDRMLGEVANYIFEVTQPVVLVSYLGLTARTPADIKELSQLIQRMVAGQPRAADSVLAVAYHAYGDALNRQQRRNEAIAAWERARTYDPTFALPFIAGAFGVYASDPPAAEKLFRQAAALKISDTVKQDMLIRRYSLAQNRRDCQAMRAVLEESTFLAKDRKFNMERPHANFLVLCEYQQAKGVAVLQNLVGIHPESSALWNALGVLMAGRPDGRYFQQAREAYARAVEAEPGAASRLARLNLAAMHARFSEPDKAFQEYEIALPLVGADAPYARQVRALLHYHRAEYAEAERLMRRNVVDPSLASASYFEELGRTLAAQDKYDEAIEILRAGIRHFPLFCSSYDTAASVLLKAGRDAEAFAQWEAGIKAIPKCDVNYVHYAKALIERQRMTEARAWLQALLKISPQSDGADDARLLLADGRGTRG